MAEYLRHKTLWYQIHNAPRYVYHHALHSEPLLNYHQSASIRVHADRPVIQTVHGRYDARVARSEPSLSWQGLGSDMSACFSREFGKFLLVVGRSRPGSASRFAPPAFPTTQDREDKFLCYGEKRVGTPLRHGEHRGGTPHSRNEHREGAPLCHRERRERTPLCRGEHREGTPLCLGERRQGAPFFRGEQHKGAAGRGRSGFATSPAWSLS